MRRKTKTPSPVPIQGSGHDRSVTAHKETGSLKSKCQGCEMTSYLTCSQPPGDGWLEASKHWDEFMSGIQLEWIQCEESFTLKEVAPFLTSPGLAYRWKQQVPATSGSFTVHQCSKATEANALAPVNGPVTKENERESSKKAHQHERSFKNTCVLCEWASVFLASRASSGKPAEGSMVQMVVVVADNALQQHPTPTAPLNCSKVGGTPTLADNVHHRGLISVFIYWFVYLHWSAVALAEWQRCPRGSPGVGNGTGSNPEILKIDGDKGFYSGPLFRCAQKGRCL